MRTSHLLAALGILAGGITAAPSAAGADAIVPIGPDQGFHGLVNGAHDKAVIKMVCPGPAYPDQTGHPVAGQTLAVAPGAVSTKGGGYTGSLGTSVAVALSAVSTGEPIVFHAYNVPQDIPTSISLPCYGTGTIRFVPLPTSGTAVPDDVTVTFVNIAV
ncbi:hypothetical protein [Actinoallomurus rhizosphaericola]|uniref:hypothetical protein n=1 Tax=Actinoallomurus rhizosphaericola TaxID=2952536 RepID=UPI00209126A6|nr:hypothetical protein [Actinoallomurus rhizosphaericola]MCO5993185.1 hypothetical protein [Actinoallomurus rhizosphaericola]